jgi:hypothetical protein
MRMTGLPSAGDTPVGSGSWIKTTRSGDVSPGSPVDVSALTGLTDLGKAGKETKAHLIGVETLDGVKAYHLQSSVTTTTTISGSSISSISSISSTIVTDYYVRQDNYRPVKITAASSGQMGTTPSAAMSTSTITLIFTAYDTGLTIDLPQV